jgi:hypothetical protein
LNSKSISAKIFEEYVTKLKIQNNNSLTMLDTVARNYLIEAILAFFLDKEMHIRTEDFERLTNDILLKYPEEEAVCVCVNYLFDFCFKILFLLHSAPTMYPVQVLLRLAVNCIINTTP